jgi:response regulator RpfG family c-di-GMP phosphodiesterase
MGGLARLGRFAELVGQALAHTVGRELSVADPQPEIDGLLAALERTVPGVGERSADAARLARLLADERGIAGPDLIELDLAARLGRAGRLRMPPGAGPWRTAPAHADRELLRLEPLWGSDMVARIPGLEAVALIVRHSRERWDGRGHPDGLAGEQIPLASRLIALAEAACSGQPVEEMAGTSLDPSLTERLAALAAEAHAIRAA